MFNVGNRIQSEAVELRINFHLYDSETNKKLFESPQPVSLKPTNLKSNLNNGIKIDGNNFYISSLEL